MYSHAYSLRSTCIDTKAQMWSYERKVFKKQLFKKSKLILVFEENKTFRRLPCKLHFFGILEITYISFQQHFSTIHFSTTKISWCVVRNFFFREKIIEPPKGLPSLNSCKFCVITTFQVSYEKSETGEWGPNEKFLSIKICKKKFSTHNLTY